MKKKEHFTRRDFIKESLIGTAAILSVQTPNIFAGSRDSKK